MKELFHFLISPTSNPNTININIGQSVKLAFRWFTKALLLALLCNIPRFIIYFFDLGPIKSALIEKPLDILAVAIIMPILEESIFRLPLKFKPCYFIISLSLFIYCILPISYGYYKSLIIASIAGIITSITIYSNKNKSQAIFSYIYHSKFHIIFYFYTLFFGFMHIANYPNLGFIHILLSPLIILPQLILGAIIGYVRVKYNHGFIMAIIIHILCNTTQLLPNIIQLIESIL